MDEFDDLIALARKKAKKVGLKKSDIMARVKGRRESTVP
jgi:hypothetical protein